MKKHTMPEMKEGGVNVTPLIDVVMCLIIFFMLVAKIGVSTGALPMELPHTVMGKRMDEITGSIILNVTDPNPPVIDEATGKPQKVNGRIVRKYLGEGPGDYPIVSALINESDRAPSEVPIKSKTGGHPFRDQLTTIVAARRKVGAEKDFSVTIRAEKDLPFGLLQVVLAEIAQAGVRNVNYAAKTKPMAGEEAPAP